MVLRSTLEEAPSFMSSAATERITVALVFHVMEAYAKVVMSMGDVIYLDRIREKLRPRRNIGLWDRIIRYLGAAGLGTSGIVIALHGRPIWPTLAILASSYPLITAMAGWHPVYHLCNLRTSGENTDRPPSQ